MDATALSPAPAPTFDANRHRRGGRPRKSEAERRTHAVKVWMTDGEHVRFLELVETSGLLTASDYLRLVGLNGGGPGSALGQRRRAMDSGMGAVAVQLARIGNNLNQLMREGYQRDFPPSTMQAVNELSKALAAYLRKLASDDDSEG